MDLEERLSDAHALLGEPFDRCGVESRSGFVDFPERVEIMVGPGKDQVVDSALLVNGHREIRCGCALSLNILSIPTSFKVGLLL
jgi:hypothetical protein